MTIINDSANFELYQLCNHYDDLYFADTQFFAHRYSNSVVLVDLANAMKAGKTCARYLFRVNLWEMEAERLAITEYLEMAFPECSTLAEMFQHLRNGAPLQDVAGLSVEISTQAGNRTFSPFATVKPQKLGERLNAAGIAKAIMAGQIVAGRTDGRYTDDYAMDAAYDFYKTYTSAVSLTAGDTIKAYAVKAGNAAVTGDGCMHFYFDPTVENGQDVKGEIKAEILDNLRVMFGNDRIFISSVQEWWQHNFPETLLERLEK